MGERKDGFDLLDKICFTVVGLLLLAVFLRSLENAITLIEFVRGVGWIVILGLLCVWRYGAY